ncbi:MAG TPA: PAS domain-containing sensor histidine kinase [Abditibacteriaceae bacterium]|jgi:PAS domain S-box-containing protein
MSNHLKQSAPQTHFEDIEAYRLLVENVEDYAIFFMDTQGILVNWNIGVQRILDYSQDEFVGQPASLIFTPEDCAQKVPEQELRTAVTQGRAVDERWHVRKDGSRFWANGIITPLYDPSEKLRGFCKIMRDFTERRRIEVQQAALLEQEQKAREQAEKDTRSKDEFLSIISHELRTPLNVIHGWTSLLRSQVLDPDTCEKACDIIERNVRIQNDLVNDLLDISRIIQNGLTLNVQTTEVVPVLAAAIEALKIDVDHKSLHIILSHQSDVDAIQADPDRFGQVISNLLTNAIKFTPDGGTIEIRTSREELFFRISVCDSGIGIKSNFLPHIFDRYRQADTSSTRRAGGLGLGLFITRTLVELHGGTITAFSDGENKGTTFTVLLPIHR